MRLVKPIIEMKNEYLDFLNDWESNNEEITPYSARLLEWTYEEWVDATIKIETEAPNGFVTANTYFLVNENNRIIGAINIRHYLNEFLLNYGGHIGYGIRPSERRKGYATMILKLGLKKAADLNINKVLITCDKDNLGSAKTIINNGGLLENEVLEGESITQRYWVEI